MTYQAELSLGGRLAVVVGGGAAAAREVPRLLAAGASVLVVSSSLDGQLEELAARGEIAVRRGGYRAADLAGAGLAVACDRPLVNAAVHADSERMQLSCVTPHDAPPAAGVRGRVLVLGGARSGKSAAAEGFLAGCAGVEYVATGMAPADDDPEWAARVAGHRARRPAHWRTTETLDLEAALTAAGPSPVLVDCLSLWLARVMDECGAWDEAGRDSPALDARVGGLVGAWRAAARPVVAVSNEVGCGVVPATASGRRYRDALGRLNAAVAAASDEVWFCTAGVARRLR